MNLVINGEQKALEAAEGLTVKELLAVCRVEQPDMVSVQLNGAFVTKESFSTTPVKEGDEVDFLYFMGGGGR